MRMLSLFLIFFICNFCAAQDQVLSRSFLEKNGAVITTRPLAVSDFKGVPDLKSANIAETHSAMEVKIVKYAMLGNSVKIAFEVLPYFVHSSWIKEEARLNPDTAFRKWLLRHEQDHYDLVILGAMEIERALNAQSEFNKDKRIAEKEIGAIYNTKYKIYSDINKYYERDVEHGANPEKQVIWNYLISSAIKAKSWDALINYMNDNTTIKIYPIK